MEAHVDVPTSDMLLIRIRNRYNSLSNAGRKIATYMLESPEEAMYLTISQIASRSGVSEASVTKFARTMGLESFQQMKISLALERTSVAKENGYDGYAGDIPIENGVADICNNVFMNSMESIRDTLKIVDIESIEKAASKIVAARKVDFYGSGTSGISATYAHLRLCRIGIHSNYYEDSHNQAISAALLGEDDVAFGISNSGQSSDVTSSLAMAKKSGATTICITNYGQSPIVKHSDIVLFTSSRDSAYLNESLCARVAQLTLIDSIYASVISMRTDELVENLKKSSEAIKTLRTIPFTK